MRKKIFSFIFLMPPFIFAQHVIYDNLHVYGNIISMVENKKVEASKGHFEQIQMGDVFIDTLPGGRGIKLYGGGLMIEDPNNKFSINGSDVWRNIYDPKAYGADNTGLSDATYYFNSKCPGGDCRNVFYPSKGTYRIEGTVHFPSNSFLKMDPETKLEGFGTLHGDSTFIDAGRYQIFGINLTFTGIWLVINPLPEWFGLSPYGDYAPSFLAKMDSLKHTDEWINYYYNPDFKENIKIDNNAYIMGNLGIGTDRPTEKLAVEGNIDITGFLNTDDTVILKSNGRPVFGATPFTLRAGWQVPKYHGLWCVTVGALTGDKSTILTDNTIIGSSSARTGTSGTASSFNGNTIIGYNNFATDSCHFIQENIMIGQYNANSVDTAWYNIWIGEGIYHNKMKDIHIDHTLLIGHGLGKTKIDTTNALLFGRFAPANLNNQFLQVNGNLSSITYNYCTDKSTTDSYKVVIPLVSEYSVGLQITFLTQNANDGKARLTINNLSPKLIKKKRDQDLVTGDIEAGQMVVVIYDGTNFQMTSQLAQ